MSNKKEMFYCYSPKLRRFLDENGIKWEGKGINKNSGFPYWLFKRGSMLERLIEEYRNKTK